MASHPIQPVAIDDHGVLRFKVNAIVRYLLDHGGIDLNNLAVIDFPREDREQFAQLIGYSVDGFSSLSYASSEAVEAAHAMAEGVPELQAVNDYLRASLNDLKESLREPIAALYGIHPDDLGATP